MKEHYGGEDNIPFTKMDCYNEIGHERTQYLEANDAQTLSDYLRNKQTQDHTCFYAVEVDRKTGHIANFFWADGQSIMHYKCFGDVVSFDTTFRTNNFEMLFAPILGTHQKQTITFWCALMFNETIPLFVWLFESFLKAMSRKHPSTIFTDQDAAMAVAIAHVFPNTTHRLCLWHIGQNVIKHLGPIIKAAKDEAEDKLGNKFWADFKSCIYEDRVEIYFTEKWDELLAKYNLRN
jgi:zinc finger SWIM domain-containing protein 3